MSDSGDRVRDVDDAQILDLPLYSITEAGRLLGIRPITLRRWLEGYTARGSAHPPIIRPEPTGAEAVTWGEFVEAGFLHEYRAEMALQQLRPLVDGMRKEFRVQYPLAQFQPLVDRAARQAVMRLQELTSTPDALLIVRWWNQQLQWSEPVEGFLHKVEFNPFDAVARRMFPLGRDVPVTIDPQLSFGVPQVRGIRTEAIVELLEAGEPREVVARMWGLDDQEVEAARTWERRLKAA